MVSKLSSEDLLDHPLIKTLYLEIEKYKDQIWEKEEEMESLNALLTEAQGRPLGWESVDLLQVISGSFSDLT